MACSPAKDQYSRVPPGNLRDLLNTKQEDLDPNTRHAVAAVIFRGHATGEGDVQDRDDPPPQLLIVKRVATETSFPCHWEVPGGKIDPAETVRHALDREVLEETGLRVCRVVTALPMVRWEDIRRVRKNWTQYVFVVEVERSVDIRLDPHEHDEWRWVVEEDVCDLLRLWNQSMLMVDAFHWARET
jgi:8-oxo-dGTP pyrophosphatase MutT (NUDIX family)